MSIPEYYVYAYMDINDMSSPTEHKCSHHNINKTVDPSQLNPGDTVIPLADLLVKATIITGSINSAIITWKFNQSWWITLTASVISAGVCWFLARYIGSLIFPVTQFDDVSVVKAGSSAIPLTLKAAFIGSSTALISLWLFICFYTWWFTIVRVNMGNSDISFFNSWWPMGYVISIALISTNKALLSDRYLRSLRLLVLGAFCHGER